MWFCGCFVCLSVCFWFFFVSVLFFFLSCFFFLEFLHSGISIEIPMSFCICLLETHPVSSFHPLSSFICILLIGYYEVISSEVFPSPKCSSYCYHCSMAQAKPALPLNQFVKQEISHNSKSNSQLSVVREIFLDNTVVYNKTQRQLYRY